MPDDIPGGPYVCELYVCEIAFLILKTGCLYRFSVDPNCDGCRRYAVYSSEENEVSRG